MIPFLLLLKKSMKGFSSDVYCGNLIELLEIKSSCVLGTPPMPGSQWDFHSQIHLHQASSSSLSIPAQASLPWHWVSLQFLLMSLCSRNQLLHQFVFSPVLEAVVLCPPLSYRSKTVVEFSGCWAFYLFLRTKWWLPNPFHMVTKIFGFLASKYVEFYQQPLFSYIIWVYHILYVSFYLFI